MTDASSTEESTARDPAETSVRSLVVVYLKGLAMGAADAVPGVSGGTIAFIVGIYERLIRALTSLDPTVLELVPSLHRRSARTAFFAALVRMDLPFLVALGLGMVSAVAILSRFVEFALESVPALTFAFFFGLIGASAVVLFERDWLTSPGRVGAAVVGFVLAFLLAGATSQEFLPHTLPVVFVAGAFAISGMLLPGISGAFILLLAGQYGFMSGTLNDFLDSLFAVLGGESPRVLLPDLLVIVVFMSGAVVGLFTIAYAVRAALDRYRKATLAFLVSLMLGALRLPVLEILDATGRWTIPVAGRVVAIAAVGAALVLVLDRYTDDIEYDTDP